MLGTDGSYKLTGFNTIDAVSARICENAIMQSDNSIRLIDSHKYNKASPICYSKGDNISSVITDENIPKDTKKYFLQLGISIKNVKMIETIKNELTIQNKAVIIIKK